MRTRSTSKYRRWTKEEDSNLGKLYQSLSLRELGLIFNRGALKVGSRAFRLGIKKTRESFVLAHKLAALKSFTEGRASHVGEKNPNWRGGRTPFNPAVKNRYFYDTVHAWLAKYHGKATKCESGICTGISKVFQWAKIRGMDYEKKRENFMMMCRSCHSKYDSFYDRHYT